MIFTQEETMTTNEARTYLIQVIEDAARVAGNKAKLARMFGLNAPAVSQWIRRGTFPGRYAYRIHKLVEGSHQLEKIQAAIFNARFTEEAS
jgi:DNA-binding transcriptional regulator YdaS (Cro superfamily)